MTVWFKQGVIGNLSQHAQKGFGKVAQLHAMADKDLFVTSLREGNHSPGSFHYNGNAFDFRKIREVTKAMIVNALGKNYDVVEHSTHFHVEYDPK